MLYLDNKSLLVIIAQWINRLIFPRALSTPELKSDAWIYLIASGPGTVINYHQTHGNNVPFRQTGWLGPQNIPSNSVRQFTSPNISVPTLPNSAGIPCLESDNSQCSIAHEAGGSFSANEWRNFSYIAVTPIGRLTNNNNASIGMRWDRPGNTPGLEMDAYHADGRHFATYCLGSRRTSNFGRGSHWFNMYMRGPRGADDGAPGACGGPNGLGQMDRLRVPRGGYFRFRGYLQNVSSRGNISAEVKFIYYFDNYVRDVNNLEITRSCPAQWSAPLARPLYENINPRSCGLGHEWGSPVSYDPATWVGESWVPRCNTGVHSFDISNDPNWGGRYLGEIQDVAVCSNNWEPNLAAFGQPPPNRMLCGIESQTDDQVVLPSVPGNCPTAYSSIANWQCDQSYIVGEEPTATSCSQAATSAANNLVASANSQNVIQNSAQAPVFNNSHNLYYISAINDRWEASWTPTTDPAQTRTNSHTEDIVWYERNDQSSPGRAESFPCYQAPEFLLRTPS